MLFGEFTQLKRHSFPVAMQSTLRLRSLASAAQRSRNTVVPSRLPRPFAMNLIRRRFKDDKRSETATAAVEAPAGAEEESAPPPKPKFNHGYLIFNPAAGQENPVSSSRPAQPGASLAVVLHQDSCTWWPLSACQGLEHSLNQSSHAAFVSILPQQLHVHRACSLTVF